jgi:hypothetical protein
MDASTTEKILLTLLGLVFVSSIAALLYQLLTISTKDNTGKYSLAINQTIVAKDGLRFADFAPVPSKSMHNLSALNL